MTEEQSDRLIGCVEDLVQVSKTHNENISTILEIQKQIVQQQAKIVLLLEEMRGNQEQLH